MKSSPGATGGANSLSKLSTLTGLLDSVGPTSSVSRWDHQSDEATASRSAGSNTHHQHQGGHDGSNREGGGRNSRFEFDRGGGNYGRFGDQGGRRNDGGRGGDYGGRGMNRMMRDEDITRSFSRPDHHAGAPPSSPEPNRISTLRSGRGGDMGSGRFGSRTSLTPGPIASPQSEEGTHPSSATHQASPRGSLATPEGSAKSLSVSPLGPAATPSSAETQEVKAAGRPAWRGGKPLDPRERFRRDVQSHLNKLTIEKFPVIAEKLAVICEEVQTREDLQLVVNLVLDKAFTEPDFSEMYADLCLVLSYRSKSFEETFASMLINKCQEQFGKMPKKLELTDKQKAELSREDQEVEIELKKTAVRGLCTTLAELTIRRMISIRALNSPTSTLLADQRPPEHFVEGVCNVLSTAGPYLDADPTGKQYADLYFTRLKELVDSNSVSKRISCLIQDLSDARSRQWHKKIHKEKAKGLSKIKADAERADLVGGAVVRAQFGTVVQLGQRTNLSENEQYGQYMAEQAEAHKQRQALGKAQK